MKKARPVIMVAIYGLLLTLLGHSVFAFSDTASDPNQDKINALQSQGIISGTGSGQFHPTEQLTYASGISLIVKGLDLNIDNLKFFKKPEVTDQFANLEDDAWYADAFIAAYYNGLKIPADVKADTVMTREEYAHYLMQAMLLKGNFAIIDLYIVLPDEADVNPAYMNDVQKLLILDIAMLGDDGNFNPKEAITRSEAAGWLYNTMEQVQSNTAITLPEENEMPLTDLSLSVAKVNEEINKVTVSAQAPHPGYGIRISSISFDGDQALISVEAIQPDPDKMYPQVVSEVHADTYIAASYTPRLADDSGDDDSDKSTAVSSIVLIPEADAAE